MNRSVSAENSTFPAFTPTTVDEFETIREFNKRFPSKLYICSRCKKTSTNPYQCTNCKNQSNNFLYQGYTYTILDTGITETIFIPIELQKESEEQHDKSKT